MRNKNFQLNTEITTPSWRYRPKTTGPQPSMGKKTIERWEQRILKRCFCFVEMVVKEKITAVVWKIDEVRRCYFLRLKKNKKKGKKGLEKAETFTFKNASPGNVLVRKNLVVLCPRFTLATWTLPDGKGSQMQRTRSSMKMPRT